jgi:predicted Fe-S protein YdhL (DUF1289 family)
MKCRGKLGGWWCGLGLTVAMALPAAAAQHRPTQTPPPHPAPAHPAPAGNGNAGHNNARNDRPPNAGNAQNVPHNNGNENGAHGATTPPNVQERWRNMTPQERQRVLQNEERLRRLPPAQQQVLRDRAQVWNRMTPEQREHIRTDVLPRWRQMPPDRKQAIRQRLRVLQNMPEYARNQRLNDPNFTRGMSEEDRSTLRDLSHLHVGGAMEPPNE